MIQNNLTKTPNKAPAQKNCPGDDPRERLLLAAGREFA